ncbi:hypothetical protein AB6V29_14555 [Microbacterium sp. 20-116]|uniref:hypothetical protein n=1 Tax=Microbacterium sp. 20-116 TaxID=3239883 RepID=UPI0034E1C1AA
MHTGIPKLRSRITLRSSLAPLARTTLKGGRLMTLLNDITAFLASLTGLVLALNQTTERFRKPRSKRKRNGRRR